MFTNESASGPYIDPAPRNLKTR